MRDQEYSDIFPYGGSLLQAVKQANIRQHPSDLKNIIIQVLGKGVTSGMNQSYLLHKSLLECVSGLCCSDFITIPC